MDNEDVVNIYNGIFLSHKKSEIVSFVEMWMDLETVIQTKISQEEKNKNKNKYHISIYMCGIQKNGMDESICKAEMETQTQRTNVWTPSGVGDINLEIGIDIYILLFVRYITNKNLLYSTGGKKEGTICLQSCIKLQQVQAIKINKM